MQIFSIISSFTCSVLNSCVCGFFPRKSDKNNDAERGVNKIFKILCAHETDIIRPRVLNIQGRNVTFNRTCGQLLDSSFEELCDRVSHKDKNLCVQSILE